MSAKYKLGTFIRFSTSPEGAETDAPPASGTINGIVQRTTGFTYFVEGHTHSFAERRPGGVNEKGPQLEIPESKIINAYREMPKKKITRTRKAANTATTTAHKATVTPRVEAAHQ